MDGPFLVRDTTVFSVICYLGKSGTEAPKYCLRYRPGTHLELMTSSKIQLLRLGARLMVPCLQ